MVRNHSGNSKKQAAFTPRRLLVVIKVLQGEILLSLFLESQLKFNWIFFPPVCSLLHDLACGMSILFKSICSQNKEINDSSLVKFTDFGMHACLSFRPWQIGTLNWLLFLRIHPFKHHLKWIQLVLMNTKQREKPLTWNDGF